MEGNDDDGLDLRKSALACQVPNEVITRKWKRWLYCHFGAGRRVILNAYFVTLYDRVTSTERERGSEKGKGRAVRRGGKEKLLLIRHLQ